MHLAWCILDDALLTVVDLLPQHSKAGPFSPRFPEVLDPRPPSSRDRATDDAGVRPPVASFRPLALQPAVCCGTPSCVPPVHSRQTLPAIAPRQDWRATRIGTLRPHFSANCGGAALRKPISETASRLDADHKVEVADESWASSNDRIAISSPRRPAHHPGLAQTVEALQAGFEAGRDRATPPAVASAAGAKPTLTGPCLHRHRLAQIMAPVACLRGRAMSEPWVSVDDVPRHLGVAKDTIYRWLEGCFVQAHRVGRLWRFKLSEVDEWVRAGGADAADEPDGSRAPKRGGHQ